MCIRDRRATQLNSGNAAFVCGTQIDRPEPSGQRQMRAVHDRPSCDGPVSYTHLDVYKRQGFQYTNRAFHHKIVQAGMTHSMSRVAHCIDNGPMEGFWGILKRERYYGRRFISKHELVQMIQQYIRYYNTRRVQRNLGVLTPMEKHTLCLAA